MFNHMFFKCKIWTDNANLSYRTISTICQVDLSFLNDDCLVLVYFNCLNNLFLLWIWSVHCLNSGLFRLCCYCWCCLSYYCCTILWWFILNSLFFTYFCFYLLISLITGSIWIIMICNIFVRMINRLYNSNILYFWDLNSSILFRRFWLFNNSSLYDTIISQWDTGCHVESFLFMEIIINFIKGKISWILSLNCGDLLYYLSFILVSWRLDNWWSYCLVNCFSLVFVNVWLYCLDCLVLSYCLRIILGIRFCCIYSFCYYCCVVFYINLRFLYHNSFSNIFSLIKFIGLLSDNFNFFTSLIIRC